MDIKLLKRVFKKNKDVLQRLKEYDEGRVEISTVELEKLLPSIKIK